MAPIDASKDPEAYAKYNKERAEKLKKQKEVDKQAEEREARLNKLKLTGSKDFKVGAQVVVVGLQKNPEKNGSLGTLQNYNVEKERWAVEFHTGSTNNFKTENLQLVESSPAEAAASTTEGDEGEIPTSKLYITGLAAATTVEDLIKLFSSIGMLDREPVRNAKGKSKGYQDEWPFAVKLYKPGQENGDGSVNFVDKVAARAAIKTYNGHSLKGSVITVQYAGGEGAKEAAEAKMRKRSRSRDRLAELDRLKKKLKDEERPKELAGIFGPDI
eukprot:CAMPEP_0183440798 /NCGR_PEP_ID=MMETSP0370-20130417/82750_1 /TAXON_ID=268820 /ORGANISM="Peridinium aciculiferum, Strain PAER-2" /LENGTH=271 /DNA_ID=CAMNT_0025629791 /DNA_START=47 /DNA_END=862 /DNA_ORIENTATION=+